jgi:hypothetical protein
MKRLFVISFLFLLFFEFAGFSQITTSEIKGIVTGENNEALAGATIVAIHTPSGTKYANICDLDGRFTISNMRVGGPYQVTISLISYASKTYNDITLSLGNVAELKVNLTPSTTELNEVVVMAGKNDVINKDRTGAAINLSNDMVTSIPSISRGLKDFTKISPLANISGSGTSFAGSNNRYNQFAIDGLVNNDVFGLSASGTNGGQTGIEPISLDAIEEFQINIAPYDVRQGGFTGGGINAITKSGTNTLHGSAYYYGNNQNLVGQYNPVTETGKSKYTKYKDYQGGITLGGPIVKDKLFFFVSGEMTRKRTPLSYAPGTSGSNITIDEVNRTLAVLNRIAPGYDPGSYDDIATETNSNKFLAKINWNISNKHKLTLRHSYTFGENIDNSRGANALRFYNNGIYFPSTTNSTGIELNSIFNAKMANRLLLGYTRVRDNRDPLGQDFPTILVNLDAGKTITIGSENSSVANQLDQDIYSLDDNFNLYQGKHTFTFGTHNEMYKFYNLFVQNIYGNYAYKNLAQFESVGTATEVAPTYYGIGYSFATDDNPKQSNGAARFNAFQLGLYAQDEYKVANNLQITAGLRIDVPIFPDKPDANADFNTAYATQGVATGTVPQTKIMWSPRVGFNWDVFNNKSLQIRGGSGLFTGRVPFVWVSNQFSNNGQLNGAYSVGSSASSANPISNPAGLKLSADPYVQPTAESLGKTAGRGAINVIDKNFNFPQVFRTNLAIDKTLPYGIIATLEGIFSKTINNINFTDLNRQVDPSFVFNGPDNRPRYTASSADPKTSGYNGAARIDSKFDEIIKLNNTNKGYSYNVVMQLQKAFNKEFNASVAYTYGESMDLNSGTSSVAYSNWRYVNQVHGLNDLNLTTSNFSMGSRIIGFISYRKDYLSKLMSTQISLFYNGQSGQPISYIYNGDLNNDGTTNDMIFIPKTSDDINLIQFTKTVDGNTVTVTPQDQWNQLNTFIESDSYLKNHRGEYAHRNAAHVIPFQHEFDLRLQQELKIKTGSIENKLQFTFDILNVGNLLNKNWGRQYFASNQQITLIDYAGLQNSGTSSAPNYSNNQPTFKYTGSGLTKGMPYSVSDLASRWRAQIGIRYIF